MSPEDDLDYEPAVQPEEADLPHRDWECPLCGFINSAFDGGCQNCDGGDVDWYALSNGLSTVMPDGTLVNNDPEDD